MEARWASLFSGCSGTQLQPSKARGHLTDLGARARLRLITPRTLSHPKPSEPLLLAPRPPATPLLPGSPQTSGIYLHSHKHLVLGRAEVVALGKEDLPKGSLAQFPLQHDVPSLNVLHICRRGQKTREQPVSSRHLSSPQRGCRFRVRGTERQTRPRTQLTPDNQPRVGVGGRVRPRTKSVSALPQPTPNRSTLQQPRLENRVHRAHAQDSGTIRYGC